MWSCFLNYLMLVYHNYRMKTFTIYILYIYSGIYIYPVHFFIICPCFKSCKTQTFYTILDILQDQNL